MKNMNLIGMVFSYLTPIKETTIGKDGKEAYVCKCKCGNNVTVSASNLTCRGDAEGRMKSCGCKMENWRGRYTGRHCLTHTKIYRMWAGMKERCHNIHSRDYKDYGARGITVCDEWKDDVKAFSDWANGVGYTEERYNREKLSLDRRNNDLGYSPGNCRFTTRSVQTRNTRLLYITNTTGYRGVFKTKSKVNPYTAQIMVASKRIYLGAYHTALEAAKAYDKYVIDNKLEHTINVV